MALSRFVGQVAQVVRREDGRGLANLFKLDSAGLEVAMQIQQRGFPVPDRDVRSQLENPWAGIVIGYLQALVHVCKGERTPAAQVFREQHVKPLQELVSSDVWALPAIISSANTLRVLSGQADDENHRKGGVLIVGQLQPCVVLLQSLFAKTAAAKGQDADIKRAAAVATACIMLKIYFRLNTLNNCKNIVSTIEGQRDLFNQATRADQVTFRYYTGRLKAYDEDFLAADQHLSFAYANCHPDAVGNRRRILRYLIPVRMLLGVLPSESLLQQFRLPEYSDMAAAMRAGNVAQLQAALEKHQVALVQSGTYLLLEKLQLAVYRRLFKKCALVHAAANPTKANQVPLALFAAALELQGVQKDDTELQCMLANLIYRKYIKGYIAYKQRVVVMAKADAFPSLTTVQLGDPFS